LACAYTGGMSFRGATDADITAALEALKERLNEELGRSLEKLVLFGSRARGDHDADSDVDVAVVIRGMDSALKSRIMDLIADVELEYLVPLSTLVLSAEDYEKLTARERRIALDIEREGIPL